MCALSDDSIYVYIRRGYQSDGMHKLVRAARWVSCHSSLSCPSVLCIASIVWISNDNVNHHLEPSQGFCYPDIRVCQSDRCGTHISPAMQNFRGLHQHTARRRRIGPVFRVLDYTPDAGNVDVRSGAEEGMSSRIYLGGTVDSYDCVRTMRAIHLQWCRCWTSLK